MKLCVLTHQGSVFQPKRDNLFYSTFLHHAFISSMLAYIQMPMMQLFSNFVWWHLIDSTELYSLKSVLMTLLFIEGCMDRRMTELLQSFCQRILSWCRYKFVCCWNIWVCYKSWLFVTSLGCLLQVLFKLIVTWLVFKEHHLASVIFLKITSAPSLKILA